jgi:ferrochelatase
MSDYDALILVSFGGPEKLEDVAPFLEDVARGRNVPRRRLVEVAGHYELFGGVSPLNSENRALLAALAEEFNSHGPPLALYWGNRHWHPLLSDTIREMAEDGIGRALALVTSAFGSYSSCRQYLDDIERARTQVGPRAPRIDKLRRFYNHPDFIEAQSDRVAAALGRLPPGRRETAQLVYTAHSIPATMAGQCGYAGELRESARLVSERVGHARWDLAYQSRSGPPQESWLEPDIGDYLVQLHRAAVATDVVIAPIGFLCEHMEIAYDLDMEIASLCEHLGLGMVRAVAVGSHPRLIRMVRELVLERIDPTAPRRAVGQFGPAPDVCPPGCCPTA